MGTAATTIPIQHSQSIHPVETTSEREPAIRPARALREPQQLTLLELVEAIGEVTDDEQEIVATVVHMISSGRVHLTGNFRSEPIEKLLAG